MSGYVHGYTAAEAQRLADQAVTLEAVLHEGTAFAAGASVLEAGSGVGAQTVALLRRSPHARFTAVDRDPASLRAATARVGAAGLPMPRFLQADLAALPFPDAAFDHAFVCFVLEHLADPVAILREIGRVVRPGGSVTVIEGDHGSALFHPDDADAQAAIDCLVALQRAAGGDARIGRRLTPLLRAAGLDRISTAPRPIYADAIRPDLADRFVRRVFMAMVAGVRDDAVRAGLVDPAAFDRGLHALDRAAEVDGTFCYTFFRSVAKVARR